MSSLKVSELTEQTAAVVTDKYYVEIASGVGRYETGLLLPSYTVATLPAAATYPRRLIYVSNEAGGAVPAFSDGTDWRRVTDRAVVS